MLSSEILQKLKSENKIIIISGATASGKSKLAQEMAEEIDGVIINADSMQIYDILPTLSCQPSEKERQMIKHELYSILDYKEKCSLGKWLELVKEKIDNARLNRKIPIITGGTGLYIKGLIEGISPIPNIPDDVKKETISLYHRLGKERFMTLLGKDCKADDKQRLIRQYEVLKHTGKTLEGWNSVPNKKLYKEEQFYHINVNISRDMLYQRCDQRFLNMLKEGVAEEVDNVFKKVFEGDVKLAIKTNYNFMKTLGFMEILLYKASKMDKEEMISMVSKKTRNYAKRQLTFFRHQFDKIDLELGEIM